MGNEEREKLWAERAGRKRQNCQRWPETCLCLGDIPGWPKLLHPEMPGNRLGLEREVGEMQLESTSKGRGKPWGVTAPPCPRVPLTQPPWAGLTGKAAKPHGCSRDVIPP